VERQKSDTPIFQKEMNSLAKDLVSLAFLAIRLPGCTGKARVPVPGEKAEALGGS
jgi:hypothetical protein